MRRLIVGQLTFSRLFYVLLFLLLILIVCTFRDYGITWDEQWHATYGTYIIWWYTSLFRNHKALEYMTMDFYGGFFEVVAQGAARFSPFGPFETRHLISALFGFLGVVYAFRLGKLLAGPFAGFLSALFLVLTPRFYGHAFFNNKDIPFAVMYLVSVYYIIKSVEFMPRLSRGMMVTLGIAIGLDIGIRFNGIILFGYLVLAFVLWLLVRRIPEPGSRGMMAKVRSAVATFAPRFLLVVAISYGTALVWWPAAQVDPIGQPLKVLTETYNHLWMNEVFFEGVSVPVGELPWYYIEKWFLITLPEFYFIALGIAAGLFGFAVVRRRNICKDDGFIGLSVLLAAALFPVAYAIVTGIVLYDSERHFLFIVPLLAVLAAVPVSAFLTQSRFTALRWIVAAMIVCALVATAAEMRSLHPYEYLYFNRIFAGGFKEGAKSYETDYWGATYKEGAEWIVKNYQRINGRKVKVASCSFPFSTEYFLPKDGFDYVGSYDYLKKMTGKDPDLFLATTRWHCHQTFNGRIVHIVERQGVPLLYVKEIGDSEKPSRPY